MDPVTKGPYPHPNGYVISTTTSGSHDTYRRPFHQRRGRRSPGPVGWDPLRETDALQEACLLDCRVCPLTGRAGLLLDMRTALQYRTGNAALLVVRGLRSFRWSPVRAKRPGRSSLAGRRRLPTGRRTHGIAGSGWEHAPDVPHRRHSPKLEPNNPARTERSFICIRLVLPGRGRSSVPRMRSATWGRPGGAGCAGRPR
jgi:hypothetical protein